MTIYTVDIQKDNPDTDKTVTIFTYDDLNNLAQKKGPGWNPSGELDYLENKLLKREDLDQDQIDMASAQVAALQQFLIDNPDYNPEAMFIETPVQKTSIVSEASQPQEKKSLLQRVKTLFS